MFLFVGGATLTEFAQFIVDERSSVKSISRFNSHFRPQYELCFACDINYDFIGHFESIQEDTNYLLAKFSAAGDLGRTVGFPILNTFDRTVAKSIQTRIERRNAYYANVPQDIITQLIRIYHLDYQLFGYDHQWAYRNNSIDIDSR